MKNVSLIFPDLNSLVDFVLVYRINRVEVRSEDLLLTGWLSEDMVLIAITEYGAEPVAAETRQL